MKHRRFPRILTTCVLMFSILGVSSDARSSTDEPSEFRTPPSYTLSEVIDLALAYHPLMEMGQGILDEKAGEVLAAQAYPNPLFGFSGGHGEVRDPTGRTLFERYFSLSQSIEWPGTRAARQQAAEASVRGAEANFDEIRLNMEASVKRTFYEVLLAETLADLASRLLRTMTDLQGAVKRRVDAGEAPPFELVKVKVEWLQAQKQVSQREGKVKTRKAALNQLTADHLGDQFGIKGKFHPGNVQVNEQRLVDQAFQEHPEIKKFQKHVDAATAKYNQEQQARIPNVTVNGAYQRDAGREGIVGGISVPLPIWNQRQGQIAQALGVRRQAEAQLQQAKIALKRGITEQIQHVRITSAQIKTFEQGLLKQAQEAVRIARTSFKFGEASLLEVLDAQRTSWQTFQAYAEARFNLAMAIIELERLTGEDL